MPRKGRSVLFLLPLLTAGIACRPSDEATTRLKPGRPITMQVRGEDLFVFEGQAGEVISLRVNSMSPGLDPNVSLVDPKGHVETSDDDSGGHGNSLIKDHALKKTGQYTAIVRSSDRARGTIEVLLDIRPAR
jgi:hypothetical protein